MLDDVFEQSASDVRTVDPEECATIGFVKMSAASPLITSSDGVPTVFLM